MNTLEETPSEIPLDEGLPLGVDNSHAVPSKPKGKTPKYIPPSKQPLDRQALAAFQAQPLDKKKEYLRNEFLTIAYLVSGKAKLLSMSLAKKDYGRLVQLLTAVGISWDKVFPKDIPPSGNNLVLNLFNGLPRDKIVRVIGEVPTPVPTPKDK